MPKHKILLVDDEPDILEAMRMLIESEFDDVEVHESASGEEAMEYLKTESTDLVISDYKMTGMNGLELLLHIHETNPRLPRVLMTAYPDLDIAINAINHANIESFITKPADPLEVVNTIRAILSERHSSRIRDQAFAAAMEAARKLRSEAGGKE